MKIDYIKEKLQVINPQIIFKSSFLKNVQSFSKGSNITIISVNNSANQCFPYLWNL